MNSRLNYISENAVLKMKQNVLVLSTIPLFCMGRRPGIRREGPIGRSDEWLDIPKDLEFFLNWAVEIDEPKSSICAVRRLYSYRACALL